MNLTVVDESAICEKNTQILGNLFLKIRNRVLRETKSEVNSEWDRCGCSLSGGCEVTVLPSIAGGVSWAPSRGICPCLPGNRLTAAPHSN